MRNLPDIFRLGLVLRQIGLRAAGVIVSPAWAHSGSMDALAREVRAGSVVQVCLQARRVVSVGILAMLARSGSTVMQPPLNRFDTGSTTLELLATEKPLWLGLHHKQLSRRAHHGGCKMAGDERVPNVAREFPVKELMGVEQDSIMNIVSLGMLSTGTRLELGELLRKRLLHEHWRNQPCSHPKEQNKVSVRWAAAADRRRRGTGTTFFMVCSRRPDCSAMCNDVISFSRCRPRRR